MNRLDRRRQKGRAQVHPGAHSGLNEGRRQSISRHAGRWRARISLAVLLALATALRVYNLTSQSLWADEGNSARVTERSLDLVVAAARADVHPPGYYLLLWGWAKVFGQGEAALRMLSVLIGLAGVALVYRLAQQVGGVRAGWFAGFCAAVSPLQVQYAQEVRMYILVACLAAAATYAFVRWIESEDWRSRIGWSLLYVLSAAAGLWVHYSFPIVIAALNLAWLAWWVRRLGAPTSGKTALWWLAAHVVLLGLYLPWLPTAWAKVAGYGAISESVPPSTVVAQALKLLAVGETVPNDDLTRWMTVGMAGLALLGAWGTLSRRSERDLAPTQVLVLGLLVLAPMAMMIGLMWAGRPAYRPKFFLVASPAFCALVGTGIAALEKLPGRGGTLPSRGWLLLGLAVVSVGAVRSLRNYYSNPAYARSDYRAIAAFIEGQSRQGDAILLDAPNQWEVFTYYYGGAAPVYPLCRSRPPQEEQVVTELEAIAAGHGRLFALYWATEQSDPDRIVERWLEANTFKASDEWYGDVRLVIYAVPVDPAATEMARTLRDVRLGEAIALRGYTLAPGQVTRGDILQVTLYWEALQVPADRYKVFLHLATDDGQPVSQFDGEPGDGMNLTTNWRPEQGIFADRYGVPVPSSSTAGEYQILVGMYHISGAPRLPIVVDGYEVGDAFRLATVKIR